MRAAMDVTIELPFVKSKKVMHLAIINSAADSEGLDPLDDDDFATLVTRHHRDLLVYARALARDDSVARDLVQEAFISAYEHARRFDATRDFASWMRGIVRNKWREWARKNRRYRLGDAEIALVDADIAAWQSQRAAGLTDLFEALEICLARLPERLSDAVHAVYFEGCTSDEASDRLGVPAAAVRKRLQRARGLLKECLDRRLEGEA